MTEGVKIRSQTKIFTYKSIWYYLRKVSCGGEVKIKRYNSYHLQISDLQIKIRKSAYIPENEDPLIIKDDWKRDKLMIEYKRLLIAIKARKRAMRTLAYAKVWAEL